MHQHRSVFDVIREVQKVGVVFKLFTPTLELPERALIAEIDETLAANRVTEEVMKYGYVAFTL